MPGLSGAADEARDRLVDTFVKHIHTALALLGRGSLQYLTTPA